MMAAEKRQFDFENSRSVKPNITSMLNIPISDTGLCSFCYWRIGPYNLPLLFILALGVLFVLYNLLLHSLITRPIEWKSAWSLHCCNLMFHCGSFLDQLSGECLKYSEGFLTVHGAFIDDYTFYLEFNSEVKNSYFFSMRVIKHSKTEYSCE